MSYLLKSVGTSIAVLAFAGSVQASYIQNGGFDDGLNGWGTSPLGDGVSVVNQGGNNVVKINDPDSAGWEWIYQEFYVPAGVNQVSVSFSYRFVNADYSFLLNDLGDGELFALGNGTQELFSTSTSSNGWVNFLGVYDISGIVDANPNGRIEFGIFESSMLIGDLTDSVLYLDNISVSDANAVAVPEPGALALLSLGMLGLGMARRRRS